MKKLFILLFTVATANLSIAQQVTETGEKEKVRNEHQDHMLIDFGYEMLTNNPPGLDFKWYNNGLNIQLFYDQLFGQSGFSAAVGVGFSTQSYYSNKQIRRDTTQVKDYSTWVTPEREYNKNKISTSYIDIPLEFRFRTKIDDWGYRWKFSVGGKVGFLIDTHDKLVDKEGIKYKTYYFPDMNRVRAGIVARAGYGKINFTSFFSLTEFFVPGRGPEQKQIGFAISLVPF